MAGADTLCHKISYIVSAIHFIYGGSYHRLTCATETDIGGLPLFLVHSLDRYRFQDGRLQIGGMAKGAELRLQLFHGDLSVRQYLLRAVQPPT